MKTHSFFNKTFVVLLCTVLAFVCVARPLQARADSASMDYVETDMSINDVKALFTGASAIVPAAIMIIGFIVMCYCVLRNVEVPLSFSSQTSFTDKLTQLGQYSIDNATDDIKDFLYSVYTYCNDNNITSVLGLSKFLVTKAGLFFNSLTKWIGGSLIIDSTPIGSGLINNLAGNLFNIYNSYDYTTEFADVFNTYSGFTYSSVLGSFCTTDVYAMFKFFVPASLSTSYDWILTPSALYLYSHNGDVFTRLSNVNIGKMYYFPYSSVHDFNTPPNRSSYSVQTLSDITYFTFSYANYSFGIDRELFAHKLMSTGLSIYFADSVSSTMYLSDLTPYVMADIITPASDNVYVPTDEWWLDISGTWESIAAGQAQILDQTERIAAFVGSIPLTLTAANSYAPTIGEAGNYVFPDFGSVWKYPQYFFDTLSGWGMFVGNCLRAVTVDEGGLSWIFYGGFVLLVCGGIIGKILMG